jgi:hypothetical protein
MSTDFEAGMARGMPMFRKIGDCSIDELYCALDDLGLDTGRLLKLNLSRHQVQEVYQGLLRWQRTGMSMKEQLVAALQ